MRDDAPCAMTGVRRQVLSEGGFLRSHEKKGLDAAGIDAAARLAGLLDRSRICGDLLSLDYSMATVLIHDKLRADVGGVSKGCFLIASRLTPQEQLDPEKEDTALILLRVIDKAPLPNAADTERMRFDAGQRVSDAPQNWDDEHVLDRYTANFLRYAGLRCRVVGTFLLRSQAPGRWVTVFGADLSNIYSGRGMKVYKPDGDALRMIVNYERPRGKDAHPLAGHHIRVGRVRYSASERQGDTTGLVQVTLDPTDLVARRTALFGMSRTGKSNTVKVIASAVFGLRALNADTGRVGQLILDANGEYANENATDKGSIRNVWTSCIGATAADVVIYGLYPHPRDPNPRRLIRLNFFGTDPRVWADRDQVVAAMTPLVQAKQVVDGVLAQAKEKYITAFRNVTLEVPEIWDGSAITRYKRVLCAYRAILAEAGLIAPAALRRADVSGVVGNDLRQVLAANPGYTRAAAIFGNRNASWPEAREAFSLVGKAINDPNGSGYGNFNQGYQAGHDGRDWHDANLTGILALYEHRGGIRLLGKVAAQHSPDTTEDYADQIVTDLEAGRLVIVDQSTGDPEMNEAAATRLMWRVFERQKSAFTAPQIGGDGNMILPSDILVYAEEAHNLLPSDGDDLKGVWARAAKEGSKYRIGLVYATQEPSSIMTNILSNTDNWFVAHLNRGAEVKEVKDFYDFGDFQEQILNVPEPGFIRMRTLSNPYVVPVQIDPYVASESNLGKQAV